MPARPCHIALTGCPGVDSPITNISAEAPDPLLFWGVPWNPYNPYKPPPLGNGQYVIEDCPGWFTSLIAQFDPVVYAQTQLWANLQALALQLGCDIPQIGDLTFQNDAQTATVHCPDGSAFSYTVDAGTITATFADPELGAAWVLAANAWALAYAFEQASALLQCGVGDPHIPHIPGDDPPDFPRGPGILENPSWMCFGENYVDNYTITGGSIITNYTMSVIAGAIPPGTVFTQTGPRSANVAGVVTAPGQYTWTIQAVSTSLPTITVTFQDSLWVMGITNASSLPGGEVGLFYSEVLQGIGGTAPYTFALDVGSVMPGGLSLASNGTISGIPTDEGDFTFDVVITDARGGECTDTILLPIVLTCVADSGCNHPTHMPCVHTNSVYIQDWATVKAQLIAPTADPAGVQPEWDGTLPVFDDWIGGPAVTGQWLPTGSAPPVYVAFAMNGLLGATHGIDVRSPGNADWQIYLQGFVGGVQTVLWHGIKHVGTNCLGTYMQDTGGAPGIASGPACLHVLDTNTDTPELIEWWGMSVPATAIVGTACSHVLDGSHIPLYHSIVAGHVGNALRLHADGSADTNSNCVGSDFSFGSTGITITAWIQSVYNISSPGSNLERIIYSFYVSGVLHILTVQHIEGGNWIADLDGAGSINKAFAAGWHFLAITYDSATGTLGFDIDQSGMTTSVVASLVADASPLTQILFGNSTASTMVGNMDTDFDECAVHSRVLTSAQLDCIYNAGAGRTY